MMSGLSALIVVKNWEVDKAMPCGGRFNLLGSIMEQFPISGQEDKTGRVYEGQTQCPKCELAVDDRFTWCPKCGARLVPFQCEYCRVTVPSGAQTCPSCGAPSP